MQGAVLDVLGEAPAKAFLGWLVQERGWGQAGWRRIDTARRNCPT
ncbi:hypothetical protein [Caulobacter sp. NIBR2454]|nr:hypothetical protein [Caulobacter sp. NIBR2454]